MNINSIFSVLIPKENKFYPILRDMSSNLLECSRKLIEFTSASNKEMWKGIYRQIKSFETKGDKILDQLFTELNNTFITPFDREDINALGERLDDVLDCINSAAKRVVIYQPETLPERSIKLAEWLEKECELINKAVEGLDSVKKYPQKIKDICSELHGLENKADDEYEHFIMDLFEHEKNVGELIKHKEIMQEIERATDKADAVGKIIKAIVVKYV
ncbi:MAG: DUF47 family protein [Fibrobacter sp.]|jgi:predicted phosphate transport protein (TIGR00153 family)|nr:DUF47 family protein [Fibrobacter sp.]